MVQQFLDTAIVPLASEKNKSIVGQTSIYKGLWYGLQVPQMSMWLPGVNCGEVMEPLSGRVLVELTRSLEAYSM